MTQTLDQRRVSEIARSLNRYEWRPTAEEVMWPAVSVMSTDTPVHRVAREALYAVAGIAVLCGAGSLGGGEVMWAPNHREG
ncbi:MULTISPECIES: hypothetical protein [Streptomyces]|uniref:Uncharacterized protein n=1 Tax=Streptomyces akebiae TaxID=2865673 RepID=A0ABX8Y6S0_9ACTN|nr:MULTISPECIES: hypothetical protein [Streptomyces]MCX5173851.1 hypothetical protein [Streptomyces antibioticus]QYX83524.1 hypothetical protein K1J60_06195 [Streptomyces akebiae]